MIRWFFYLVGIAVLGLLALIVYSAMAEQPIVLAVVFLGIVGLVALKFGRKRREM